MRKIISLFKKQDNPEKWLINYKVKMTGRYSSYNREHEASKTVDVPPGEDPHSRAMQYIWHGLDNNNFEYGVVVTNMKKIKN